MLENPTVDSPAAVKRYAPPNQRNRLLGRRKSGGVETAYYSVLVQLVGEARTMEEAFLISPKSTDFSDGLNRLERASTYANDGERNHISSTKTNSIVDHGDAGVNKSSGESYRSRLIPLHGCSNSEASQLLNTRWTAAMSAYNNLPENSIERPVLYTKKSASVWGHAFLPHLMIQPMGSSGLQRDFLSELRQAMNNANSGP